MFRHASYQSMSSPPAEAPATKPTTAVGGVHKGLQRVVFAQILCVTLSTLLVVHIESGDGKALPWSQTFYNPQIRVWLPVLALVGYVASCLYLRLVFPTHRAWLLKTGLVLATLNMCLLVAFAAAYTVCDPIVRLVRDSTMDHMVIMGDNIVKYPILPGPHEFFYQSHQHPSLLLTPLSQVSAVGPGWIAESDPDFFECAALTPYALEGRLMVGLALINVGVAFLMTTTIAHFCRGTFHASTYAIILYCFLLVILVECVLAVVINDSMWDWRFFYLILLSAIASSYLSASVVHLAPPPLSSDGNNSSEHIGELHSTKTQLLPKTKPPPTVPSPATSTTRAAWLAIQPILVVGYFLDQLDDEDSMPSAEPVADAVLANNAANNSGLHHV